jgi:hypothetical protein
MNESSTPGYGIASDKRWQIRMASIYSECEESVLVQRRVLRDAILLLLLLCGDRAQTSSRKAGDKSKFYSFHDRYLKNLWFIVIKALDSVLAGGNVVSFTVNA